MSTDTVVRDGAGIEMFRCTRCGAPLLEEDFGDLGLRLPHHGESREEYQDAELLDSISHVRCVDARAHGGV